MPGEHSKASKCKKKKQKKEEEEDEEPVKKKKKLNKKQRAKALSNFAKEWNEKIDALPVSEYEALQIKIRERNKKAM